MNNSTDEKVPIPFIVTIIIAVLLFMMAIGMAIQDSRTREKVMKEAVGHGHATVVQKNNVWVYEWK